MLCRADRPDVEGILWHRFRGAIDELHIASSVLYAAEFVPSRTLQINSDTLLAIDFDDMKVVDAASLGHIVSLEGAPTFEAIE